MFSALFYYVCWWGIFRYSIVAKFSWSMWTNDKIQPLNWRNYVCMILMTKWGNQTLNYIILYTTIAIARHLRGFISNTYTHTHIAIIYIYRGRLMWKEGFVNGLRGVPSIYNYLFDCWTPSKLPIYLLWL